MGQNGGVKTEPSPLNWVELDRAALCSNIEQFRRRLGQAAFAPVVKSNAYGHGMLEVASVAREAGVEWLCVNNLDEAAGLRQAGHTARILVMGHIPLERLEAVVELDLRPVIYNRETVQRLGQLARRREKRVAVHLKIETGTQRQGVAAKELPQLAALLRDSPGLMLEGVTTHFANIEDTTDHGYAEIQIARFTRLTDTLVVPGQTPPMRHAACSAAALLFTHTHLDLARVGISLYGLWPSRETYVSCLEEGQPTLELRPVLTWKTRVAQVKDVPAESFIGYGCTYRTTRASRIAVLPVGYHEGYDQQ